MIRTSRFAGPAAVALLAAAAIAGCGGSTGSSPAAKTTSSVPTAPASTAGSVVIGSFKTPQDGTLITGARHRSLYILQADLRSTTAHDKLSTCYAACATAWPPVLASKLPSVADKASSRLVGLTARKDGTKQVTYNGLPLYYYIADTKAGQATGNHLTDGFGLWLGVLPNGKPAPDGAN